MKTISAILLSLLLTTNIFKNSMGYLSFALNRDFIAKTFCIQKEVENNCCKGSCYLQKRVEENSQETSTPNKTNLKTNIPLLVYISIASNLSEWNDSGSFRNFARTDFRFRNGFLKKSFRPPPGPFFSFL